MNTLYAIGVISIAALLSNPIFAAAQSGNDAPNNDVEVIDNVNGNRSIAILGSKTSSFANFHACEMGEMVFKHGAITQFSNAKLQCQNGEWATLIKPSKKELPTNQMVICLYESKYYSEGSHVAGKSCVTGGSWK